MGTMHCSCIARSALLLFVTVFVANVIAEQKVWYKAYGDGDVPEHRYYRCAEGEGCEIKKCGSEKRFDREQKKCVEDERFTREKRQVAVVGAPCQESTDCRRGSYCNSLKRCACLSTYTRISGYCWQKINPGQAGCTYNQQCSAVWPNAYCNGGTCRCGNNAPPFLTRDGYVCVNYGFCPINGQNTKYKDNTGVALSCPFGFDGDCPAGYDCICSNQDCTVDGVVTFCCPGRGLACIMPLDSGTSPSGGGGSVTRYYHNSVTGNCETFSYRGANGNANNFESLDQCESYCKQTCKRGSAQYDQPIYPAIKERVRYCTSTSSTACASTYYCYEVGTQSLCCPKASTICSVTGGLPSTTTPSSNFDQGSSGGSTVTFPRYYYDVTVKRCQPFTYLGQGGNYNNFLSEEQCTQYCATILCTAGEPLLDTSGINNVACSSSSGCPATHECTNSVCCPRKQTVCSQPKAAGTCGNYVQRWWYNGDTRNCELFTYSGCQGNANNFDTYDDCQNFCRDAATEPKCVQGRALKDSYGNYYICGGTQTLTQTCPANYLCYFDGNTYGCCPTQAYTCSLNYDAGSVCGPSVTRWYFNGATRTCQTYSYNGCDGNSNNFATQTDCQDYCGVGGCAEGGEPFKEVSGQYRVCTAGVSCPSTHFCTQVTLGTSTSYNYCCPTRTYVCSLPRDQGTLCSVNTITRYFFNVATKNCESFTFNGCDGNRNNFATLSACLNYCNSAGCPPGQIALQDTTNNQLSVCTTGNNFAGGPFINTCATGYSCVYSNLLGQGICCGSTASADTCPSSQSAYVDPYTNSALQCQPNVQGSCPSGFVCWYSATQNSYYCCGSAAVQCPQGGSAYIDTGTNAARQCTPGVTGACPATYTCQPTSITISNIASTTGYCCGGNNLCGNGYEPYLLNQNAVACNPRTANVCPAPFQCRQTTGTGQYYCCRPTQAASVDVCGLGRTPYVVNNAPVVCSTGSTSTNCPNPYQCLLYSATNTFYCCQTGGVQPIQPIQQARCPPGYNPLQQNGQFTYCSPSSNSCPPNYYCQFDSQQSRYICCGTGQAIQQAVTCPDGSQSSTPCSNGLCNSGLTCQSIGNQQYCCPQSQVSNVCPSGLSSYSDPGTRQPQRCTPGSFTGCPNGYNCIYSPTALTYYCCGTGAVATTYCPSNYQVYVNSANNQPQICTPGITSCPGGYQCLSSSFGAYYCCSTGNQQFSNTCAGGRAVYIQPGSSAPASCSPGSGLNTGCPQGYTCEYSSSRFTYQCCQSSGVSPFNPQPNIVSDQYGCPSGRSYLYPGTSQPLSCQLGGSSCPSGYDCRRSVRYNGYQCCSRFRKSEDKESDDEYSRRMNDAGKIGCKETSCKLSSPSRTAKCIDDICTCARNEAWFNGKCVTYCPRGYRNDSGRCMKAILRKKRESKNCKKGFGNTSCANPLS